MPVLNLFKSAFKVLGWVIFSFVRIISRQMQTITGKGLYSACVLCMSELWNAFLFFSLQTFLVFE